MLSRSLVAVFLSLPAAILLIALMLVATPPLEALRLPSLLMVFPLWVAIATASFLIPRARTAALVLGGVSVLAYGLMVLTQNLGVGGA